MDLGACGGTFLSTRTDLVGGGAKSPKLGEDRTLVSLRTLVCKWTLRYSRRGMEEKGEGSPCMNRVGPDHPL